MENNSLLDKQGVADFLNVSYRTVDTLRFAHGLPFIKIGSQIRFSLDAVNRWIDQKTNTGNGSPKGTTEQQSEA